MARFDTVVTVTLKPGILDPAGEATATVLKHLGYSVVDVTIGRYIRMQVEAGDAEEARRRAGDMAQELLANPVMERFTVEVMTS